MATNFVLLDSGLRRNDGKNPVSSGRLLRNAAEILDVSQRVGREGRGRKILCPRYAGCLPSIDHDGCSGSGSGVGVVSGCRGVRWLLVFEPPGPPLGHGVDHLSTEHAGSDAEQKNDRAKELNCGNCGEKVSCPPQNGKQASNGSAVKQIHTDVETAFLLFHA